MEATTSPETGRSKRKREAKAAFERRAIREALEARIRKVLSTPPGDRTPEGWALLDEHAAVVAPLMANLTRSLRRKAQTEERLEEREDPPEVMMEHVAVLVQMIRQRGTFVMHTGAGFSTAAAIPDFRGRNGIWTQQAKGRAVPMPRFENTKPTKAHLAAVALYNAGYLTHVITQNVDGLHQRAGMPKETVSELHGSVYREVCKNESCPMGPDIADRTYHRTFDVTATKPHNGRHRHKTGRVCDGCGGDLHDTVVQFGEHLDDDTLDTSVAASEASPLSLVCGTSLKVPPASTLPRRSGALVVCNLQWTSQDRHASLKIHAKCDEIMLAVCKHLEIDVPEYDPSADPIGSEVVRRGGRFATPNAAGDGEGIGVGVEAMPDSKMEMIRNAAAIYGGGGGTANGGGGTPGGGTKDTRDDAGTYASPETWEGGRRDAVILFGSDQKAARRRSKGGRRRRTRRGRCGGDEDHRRGEAAARGTRVREADEAAEEDEEAVHTSAKRGIVRRR
jgi:NAD-dependent SIR2 family protein deacetylase